MPRNSIVSKRSLVSATLIVAGLIALGALMVLRKEGAGQASTTVMGGPHTIADVAPEPVRQRAILQGRILGTRDTPLSAARVCATCANCASLLATISQCTSSSPAGAFSLQVATDKAYVLSAQAPGYVTGYAHEGKPFFPREGKPDHVELRLVEGRENLSGTIIDVLGGPVAQARVKLIRFVKGLAPTVEVIADEDGHFAATVPEGSVTLRVEADGYAPRLSFHRAPNRHIQVALTPEAVVHGVVVESGTGTPVAGATILAHPAGAAPNHPETVSDEAGAFVLRGLEPGRYVFSAEGDRHRGATHRPLEIGLTERMAGLRIEVDPAILVSGRVEISSSDAPCPAGAITLGRRNPLSIPVDDSTLVGPTSDAASSEHGIVSTFARIEHDGSVRFKGVPVGRYHVTLACQDHIYDSGPAVVDVRPDTPAMLWKVRPGTGLRVRVVDATKKSVPHAKLTLRLPGKQPASKQLLVDGNGLATTSRDLSPGTYQIVPDAMYGAEPMVVELPSKGDLVEVTLTLPGSGEVTVSVKATHGEAVDDVRVFATRLDDEANAQPSLPESGGKIVTEGTPMPSRRVTAVGLGEGRFQFGALRPATYKVEVKDGDNPTVVASPGLSVLGSSRTSLEATIDRAGSIRGKVVDENGNPVASAWIKARSKESMPLSRLDNFGFESQGLGSMQVLSDEDGNFRVEALSRGATYALTAEKSHGGYARVENVREGSELSLTLPNPGSLQGRILDEDGEPVRSFDISAALLGMPETAQSARVVSQLGKFRFEAVPAGQIQLHVVRSDGARAEQVIEVAPTQVVDGISLSVRRTAISFMALPTLPASRTATETGMGTATLKQTRMTAE